MPSYVSEILKAVAVAVASVVIRLVATTKDKKTPPF